MNEKKKCKMCGAENEFNLEVCIACGQKMNDETKEVVKETLINDKIEKDKIKKSKFWRNFVLLMIGLMVILVLPTTVSIPYQKLEDYQEPYTVQESYLEQVPYTYVENYYVKEPYTYTYYEKESFTDTRNVEKYLDYSINEVTCSQYVKPVLFISEKPAKVSYHIYNHDSIDGVFEVWVGFVLPNGYKTGQSVSAYVSSYQLEELTFTFNGVISSCTYDVKSVPKKTVIDYFTNSRDVLKSRTEYKDVMKSREITRYRDETKYRDVIKYRHAQRYVTDYDTKSVMMYQRIFGWC